MSVFVCFLLTRLLVSFTAVALLFKGYLVLSRHAVSGGAMQGVVGYTAGSIPAGKLLESRGHGRFASVGLASSMPQVQ